MMGNFHILELPIKAFVTAVSTILYKDPYKRPTEYDLVFLNQSLGWHYLSKLANRYGLNEDVTLKELLIKMIEMKDFEGPNRYKMAPLESYLFDQFNITIEQILTERDQTLMELDPNYNPIPIVEIPIEVLKTLSLEEWLFLKEELNIYNIQELISAYKSLMEKESDTAIIITHAVNQLKEYYSELYEYLMNIQSEKLIDNIEILNLPDRIYEILLRNKIDSISKLSSMLEQDLIKIEGLGVTSIDIIKKALQEKELYIKRDIKILNLTNRICKILLKNKIDSISTLTGKSEEELMEIKNLGRTGVDLIKEALKEKGQSLKEEKELNTLGLPALTLNALLKSGIDSVSSLTGKSEEELMEIKNLGRAGVDLIKEVLKEKGQSLKEEKELNTLGLPALTLNALLKSGIDSISSLTGKSEEELMEIKYLGCKGVDLIKKALQTKNLTLKQK
jgi:DNA-directed RNA polymerase alpha subunit